MCKKENGCFSDIVVYFILVVLILILSTNLGLLCMP